MRDLSTRIFERASSEKIGAVKFTSPIWRSLEIDAADPVSLKSAEESQRASIHDLEAHELHRPRNTYPAGANLILI